ncbi:hypothetical protein JYB62_16425 [Algoriphagus lutimaris]|uniref:hypothetical protein n=1 Tax=Algoriphagus lutimaris TaxID=613197 RepID=UPI00196B1EE0|nr:hypothetical protein [Algoriphagus lutimaris]MBN3521598.1 hypothetical protein [Algoriphagus lutimaris]
MFGVDLFFGNLVYSNDFLGIVSVANHLDYKSLHIGVYPPGYFLWILFILKSGIDLLIGLKAFNWAIILGFSLITFIFFKKKLSLGSYIFFLILTLASSQIFITSLLDPGSYPMFLFFASFGLIYISSDKMLESNLAIFFLILSTWIRYEGFALIGSILISSVILKSNWQMKLKSILALIGSILIYSIVAYVSTGQFFTSPHHLLYEEPNWLKIEPNYDFRTYPIIEFIHFYLTNLSYHWYYFLILLISYFILKDFRQVIVVLLLYFFLIKLHPSPRGIFLIIPFAFLFFACFVESLKPRLKIIARVFLCFAIVPVVMKNYSQKKEIKDRYLLFEQIDSDLKTVEPDWSIQNVFTNSHDFYLKNQLPKTPKVNGGWMKLVPSFYKDNPNLSLNSPQEFIQNLEDQKIEFVLLDKVLLSPIVYPTNELNTLLSLKDIPQFQSIITGQKRYLLYRYESTR